MAVFGSRLFHLSISMAILEINRFSFLEKRPATEGLGRAEIEKGRPE
jgi:hypothetical protein